MSQKTANRSGKTIEIVGGEEDAACQKQQHLQGIQDYPHLAGAEDVDKNDKRHAEGRGDQPPQQDQHKKLFYETFGRQRQGNPTGGSHSLASTCLR